MKTREIIFPNYKRIDDINQDYTNFKVMTGADNIATIKEKMVRHNS